MWRGNPTKWLASTTPEYRRQRYLADTAAEKPEKPEPVRRAYAKRFSTDYAIEWGKKQGWKLVDRERYDHRTKRAHDLMLGMDAIMEGPEGLIGIQGAGRSERKPHWERFCARGGVEKAARRHLQIYYVEFDRGNKEPVLTERWV